MAILCLIGLTLPYLTRLVCLTFFVVVELLHICLLVCLYFKYDFIIQGGPKKQACFNVDNSAMVTCRKACDMSNVLERCRQKGTNLLNKSFKYSLLNLHKFLLSLKIGICLHTHVPEFIELKNSLPKSPDLNSVNYSVWGIATDSVVTKFQ